MENPVQLINYALAAGAAGAVVVSAGDIVINPGLADMCRHPGCPDYGLSANCPPHIGGPSIMKRRLEFVHQAVVFRMDVSAEDLFSDKLRRVFQGLHEIAAGVEQAAVKTGWPRARGYAGGSCRKIFCYEAADCPALSGNGACRYPLRARPSLSGFGIDVAALFETAGWRLRLADPRAAAAADKTVDLCGLVLL